MLGVGALRGGHFGPAFDKPAVGFVVVWQDDRDRENDRLATAHAPIAARLAIGSAR